jgi:hypothetical protein
MYYVIYKITNQIDGKFYIGSHKTKDLNDNYMGSGKYLKKAQEKYGIENFKKEILFVFDTADEMYKKEAEIVNEDFLATENTYNLKIGGFGGWDYINEKALYGFSDKEIAKKGRKITNELLIEKYGSLSAFASTFCKKGGFSCRDKQVGIHDPVNKQKYLKMGHEAALSEKAREKRKKTLSEINHQQGEKNSQYGKRWIYSKDLKISKSIKKSDPLPEGWSEGRKIKFD